MLKDFKQYLLSVQAQYFEMKNDLADYEEAFKNGYITEDKLEETKNYIYQIEQNYQRLLYVAFLLEQPRKKEKRDKFTKNKSNQKLQEYFTVHKADEDSVKEENKSLLDALRKELKGLSERAE